MAYGWIRGVVDGWADGRSVWVWVGMGSKWKGRGCVAVPVVLYRPTARPARLTIGSFGEASPRRWVDYGHVCWRVMAGRIQ